MSRARRCEHCVPWMRRRRTSREIQKINNAYGKTSIRMDQHCIPRCQCMTLKGHQCTRPAVMKQGKAQKFCTTHKRCGNKSRDLSRRASAQRTIARSFRKKRASRERRRRSSDKRKQMRALSNYANQMLDELATVRKSAKPAVQQTPPVAVRRSSPPPVAMRRKKTRSPLSFMKATNASRSRRVR